MVKPQLIGVAASYRQSFSQEVGTGRLGLVILLAYLPYTGVRLYSTTGLVGGPSSFDIQVQ